MSGLELFHFLRPWWLLAFPVIGLLWWYSRRRETSPEQLPVAFPRHLAEALTTGQRRTSSIRPVDTVVLAYVFAVIAVAGPTWSKEPSPWFAETAPLVVAIEVTDSMRANDLAPTRLDRARFKIQDLIASRTGARTALVAYAGSAHAVMPATKDAAVIKPFLESLDPLIMPTAGSHAARVLPLARELLGEDSAIATILFVTDGFVVEDLEPFSTFTEEAGAPSLAALVVGTQAGGLALMPDGTPVRANGSRIDTAVDEDLLERVATAGGVDVVRVDAAGQSDIRTLNRVLTSNLRQADDPNARWRDQGWWFLLPAALLVLIWFRRGWTMIW